jgi:hypothetical protein
MKKNSKGLVIVGLAALCVVLTAGLYKLNQVPKGIDVPTVTGSAHAGVIPSGIETPNGADRESSAGLETPVIEPSTPAVITVRPITDIAPMERATPTPGQSALVSTQNGNDIALTSITGRPEPPELPKTAFVWEQDEEVTPEDVAAYEALDPALKNPDVRPDITPAPVQSTPAPQAPNSNTSNNIPQSTSNSGDTDNNGLTYFPGFGWIKYEGGGTQITQSQLDPNHADFDKIIGY